MKCMFCSTDKAANLAIYAEWTLLPYLFGPVHFQFKGCLVCFTIFLRRLIWVYAVCKGPIYWTQGLNGLIL